MITSAKHEGYISVWARVRSTRVPDIIHHEGRGCKGISPDIYRPKQALIALIALLIEYQHGCFVVI